jgi:hypothetical protein
MFKGGVDVANYNENCENYEIVASMRPRPRMIVGIMKKIVY